MRAYGKVIMAVLGAAVFTAYGFLDDGHLVTDEIIKIIIAVVLAINVYVVPVTPEWPWMKTAIGAVLAALQVLVVVIVGGVTTQEVVEIVIAVLTALGVAVTPAISHNGQAASP